MKAAGLENVRKLPFRRCRTGSRGSESAPIRLALEKPSHMLGLGMSVATPPDGITAEVVSVASFDELAGLGREKVEGRIVLYNQEYRVRRTRAPLSFIRGVARAALGAVAALVRSATPLAMQIPHTGEMNYDDAQPRIPAAAVSPEDAIMMARLTADGVPVKVHLEMAAHMEPDADSGDVVGEIPGKTHPEEVVVIGGHIDSWDVGQGAQDDGAAIIACLQALATMKKLGLQPQRTIRVAFWVNEENRPPGEKDGRGGVAYRAWVGDKIGNHVAAIEMDGGAEAPRRIRAAGVDAASLETLKQIARLLERIGGRDFRRRRRFRYRALAARWRPRPGRAYRGHALLRLAPFGSRYVRQSQPRRFPQERGFARRDGLRAGRHAGRLASGRSSVGTGRCWRGSGCR